MNEQGKFFFLQVIELFWMYFKLTAQQQHQSGTPDADFGNFILTSLEIKMRCWRQAGSMLEACWMHAGTVLGDAGGKLGACCRQAGSMLETCWEHAASVQGDAGGKLGACWEWLEACWKRVGGCWEHAGRFFLKNYLKCWIVICC